MFCQPLFKRAKELRQREIQVHPVLSSSDYIHDHRIWKGFGWKINNGIAISFRLQLHCLGL
jgi:hypothetical protein